MAPSRDQIPRTNRDRSPLGGGKSASSVRLSAAISARSVRLTRRDCSPIVDLLCALLVGVRPPLVGASAHRTRRLSDRFRRRQTPLRRAFADDGWRRAPWPIRGAEGRRSGRRSSQPPIKGSANYLLRDNEMSSMTARPTVDAS